VAEKIELIAQKGDVGLRLDIFLSNHLPLTRSAAVHLITGENVKVDGTIRRSSYKLKEGMLVHISMEHADEPDTLQPYDIPLKIIYEDSSMIVIDKPAGLVVHPGAGNRDKTLVNALINRYPEISGVGNEARPGIVHRLDKLTSGVMVVARSDDAYHTLIQSFQEHKHSRVYKALCYGHMEQDSGRIETLMHRHPKDRKKMSSMVGQGRKAVTNWEVLAQWPQFSLLKLSLETGRTHQIRVHLSDMGHPVVADPQYGGKKRANSIIDPKIRSYVKSLERQMLHSCLLGINHPATGELMEFTSEIPEDMVKLIDLFDSQQG
jgi:23S rRNA pseudouridine1911/1915/1917 synthase